MQGSSLSMWLKGIGGQWAALVLVQGTGPGVAGKVQIYPMLTEPHIQGWIKRGHLPQALATEKHCFHNCKMLFTFVM